MAQNDTIKIDRLPNDVHTKQWVKLEGGTQFKNVGMIAEVGYSTVLNTPPATLRGEQLLTGEATAIDRGESYILQDAYYSYEFVIVG